MIKDYIKIIAFMMAFLLGVVCCFLTMKFLPADNKNQVVERIDTSYITVTDTFILEKPIPRYISLPAIPPDIDTAAVIADYYSNKMYRDTLADTEHLTAILTDSISENAIQNRKFVYEIRMPEITRTNTIYKKYVLSAALLMDSRASVALQGNYKSFILQGGYNIRYKEPFVGIGIKLFEK